MVSKDVLDRLRCMHSHTSLCEASSATLHAINQSIAAGELRNGLGQLVSEPFVSGLVNESLTYFYPIINGVVQMLRDEIICLESVRFEENDE